MAEVKFKGTPVALGGPEVKPGQAAPDFAAVDTSLQTVRLRDAKGKVVILSSVPSLDTPVCDTETRRFNEEVGKLGAGVELWTVSMDLPFAQKRWCSRMLFYATSDCPGDAALVVRAWDQTVGVRAAFYNITATGGTNAFSDNTEVVRVAIKDGPLAGVNARAVFVVGKDGAVKHVEYVKEITSEPNYEAALGAAKQAVGA